MASNDGWRTLYTVDCMVAYRGGLEEHSEEEWLGFAALKPRSVMNTALEVERHERAVTCSIDG